MALPDSLAVAEYFPSDCHCLRSELLSRAQSGLHSLPEDLALLREAFVQHHLVVHQEFPWDSFPHSDLGS
jgi:hypothetical protein